MFGSASLARLLICSVAVLQPLVLQLVSAHREEYSPRDRNHVAARRWRRLQEADAGAPPNLTAESTRVDIWPQIEERVTQQGGFTEVADALQAALDIAVEYNGAYGSGILRIESSDRDVGLLFAGASGNVKNNSDPSDEATTYAMPFEIASIGKMFTAAVILQLRDEGLLDLDDTIAQYLSFSNQFVRPSELSVTSEGGGFVIPASLHHYDGDIYTANLTIRELLSHTSGVVDYWELEEFWDDYEADADRYWFGVDTLIYPAEEEARFVPSDGSNFHYTDTAYVVLGLVIERIEEKKLSQVYRERIFDPLRLNSTYSQYRETRPSVKREVSRYAIEGGLGMVDMTNTLRNTAEWAGGCMASDAGDLALFLFRLLNGSLVSLESRQEMQRFDIGSPSYGLGLSKQTIETDEETVTLLGHSGYGQAFAYFSPELRVAITGSLNNNLNSANQLLEALVKALAYYNPKPINDDVIDDDPIDDDIIRLPPGNTTQAQGSNNSSNGTAAGEAGGPNKGSAKGKGARAKEGEKDTRLRNRQ
ncbi:unnamed protein product [Vitrella brassicaformis CCMP3155]|uniref:Beta-lactamase-related domain-containing protein n=2 Tax=Vitrella brassicaformis TaxID=1169539 RepID=A0A0G4EGF6_VITBC|nr:unnamed protein product [Vitrella brassicaformis CCMP3155]|eukprot:CEL94558.1 unnamed protein product [Vitrella brassicaformis CCMP3155]